MKRSDLASLIAIGAITAGAALAVVAPVANAESIPLAPIDINDPLPVPPPQDPLPPEPPQPPGPQLPLPEFPEQGPATPVPPPPEPLEGPGVSWDLVLGGLVAHITDRSGVASQCSYQADEYQRSFFLPADSTYDLRIVPAVPKFDNWDVTIACDNGATTQTSTFF